MNPADEMQDEVLDPLHGGRGPRHDGRSISRWKGVVECLDNSR